MSQDKRKSPCTAGTVTEATHKSHIKDNTSRIIKQGEIHIPLPIKLHNLAAKVLRLPRKVPKVEFGVGLGDTVEGCVLWNCGFDIYTAVNPLFKSLPSETKYAFAFSPQAGEFVERAKFWKALIALALPPEQACIAFCSVIQWYKKIKIREASV